jgi:hypothetical protein
MMLLLAVAILPRLFWDAAPDTAAALREAGIRQIVVPASRAGAWQGTEGITVETLDLASAIKAEAPSVDYRANEATASRSPWIDSNGWQFLRRPRAHYVYDAKGGQAALAAAEAFCYGVDAVIRTNEAGLQPLGLMLGFLRKIGGDRMAAVADIGFVDNGSDDAGEVMNLMVRDNLLFQIVPGPESNLKLTVRLGSKEFPAADAGDPSRMAHLIRAALTDERRSVRVYGSLVVVTRLEKSAAGLRVHLLNYAGAARRVDGVRVRVLGRFPGHVLMAEGSPDAQLMDYLVESDATEFTLPELKTYAVVELSR